MSWIDLVGFAASGMVLATFCMTQMLPLRLFAIMSNILFGAYAYLDHLYPVLLLHLLLLPVNCVRLRESLTKTRLHARPFSARTNSHVRVPPTGSTNDAGVRDGLISHNHRWRYATRPVEHLRFPCDTPEAERAV
jgi:hypothetical protein